MENVVGELTSDLVGVFLRPWSMIIFAVATIVMATGLAGWICTHIDRCDRLRLRARITSGVSGLPSDSGGYSLRRNGAPVAAIHSAAKSGAPRDSYQNHPALGVPFELTIAP